MSTRSLKPGSGAGKRPYRAEAEPATGRVFPVIGVGASAGGLDAFTILLKGLAHDTGIAFVLVQHADPPQASAPSDILSRATAMPVVDATNELAVRANHVYVIPSHADATIQSGVLRLSERPRAAGRRLPVDGFLGSLAEDRKSSAIGIVLSGTSPDGTRGLRAIQAGGGLTFAQDEGSALGPRMPGSVVATGCADFVLPPEKIAAELNRIGRQAEILSTQPDKATRFAEEGELVFDRICHLLQRVHKVDFLQYRPDGIGRHIGRRMAVRRMESPQEYLKVLSQNPLEVAELYQDILFHVTGFFRDPVALQSLQAKVLPNINTRTAAGQPFRVWVPGCSTGEEAYSLAMLLLESLNDGGEAEIQLFGTDINEAAIRHARASTYPEVSLADVSPERLRRFFVKVEGGYQVDPRVRELCLFARHDLTRDPPFSKLDLISCRNVLPYLNAPVEKRTMDLFHYALRPRGHLFLGVSESIEAYGEMFEPEAQEHKIFSRKPAKVPLVAAAAVGGRTEGDLPGRVPAAAVFRLKRDADRMADRYAPAAIVVDPELQIINFQGDTSSYLTLATGGPSFHLLRMLRAELAAQVGSTVQKVKREGTAADTLIPLKHDDGTRAIRVEVVPLEGRRPNGCDFLVLLQEKPPEALLEARTHTATAEREQTGDGGERAVLRLKVGAASTRDTLQPKTADDEVLSEELRTANEELQSSNEELQTATEELQSSNEELITLNEELQNRNAELVLLTCDLGNLLEGVNHPIIILDHDMRIRRFTPAAEKLLNLVPGDVGRAFGHIASKLQVTDWDTLFGEAAGQLRTVEREVQDHQGHWYALRIRPYQGVDNKIEGVLIALLDIDLVKRSLEHARQAQEYGDAIVETTREPLLVLDGELRVMSANTNFYETFRTTAEQTVSRSIFTVGNGQWEIPRLRQLLEELLPKDTRIDDFEVDHEFPVIGRRKMVLHARQLYRSGMRTRMILLAIKGITEQVETLEGSLLQHQQGLQTLTAQLISSQDASSKQLAQRLDDGFSQKLAALSMRIAALEQSAPMSTEARRKESREIASEIGELAAEMHRVSHQLHPTMLEDLGLAAALNHECVTFSKEDGIRAEFTAKNVHQRLPEDVSLCLYRVAQEGLRNIGKHSLAAGAQVVLTGGGGEVVLVIEDAGRGFHLEEARGGLGLASMEERVRLVDGTLSIRTELKKGTRLEVRIPLRTEV